MAATGSLSPLVGAWAPTVIFGALGIVLFDTVRS
jgi:lipopolysaccharide export LptBFGC system permease protein LptF